MSQWLISGSELHDCYRQADVVVVDCRFALADPAAGECWYQQEHIEGAHYLHLEHDLSGPKAQHGGRHPLPDPAVFVAALQSMGVSDNTLVVAYDDQRFAFASRLWWLLRYIGHERVKVLNGGFKAWREAGFAVTAALPDAVTPGSITLRLRPELLVDITVVKALADQPQAALIDSRESERFLGLQEPIDPVAGHIDGAVNYPWTELCDSRGEMIGSDQLQQRWAVTASKETLVVYCGSGVTACVNLLSLAEIGRSDARLYAGSWSDWCSYLEAAD